MTIAYRNAVVTDVPFIVSSWSRSYKESRSAGMIASDDWESVMHPQIRKVLARSGTRAIVAIESTDPDFLYGWIAGNMSGSIPVVFYTYVKESYRRAGYARGLLRDLGVDPSQRFAYTCWTPVILKLATKIPFAKHNPNHARYVTRSHHGNDEVPAE